MRSEPVINNYHPIAIRTVISSGLGFQFIGNVEIPEIHII